MIHSFGIIGYGSFGSLFAQLTAPHAEVVIYSRRELSTPDLPKNVRIGNLENIAKCEVVVLAGELTSFEDTCKQLQLLVKPETIVMDVCSVKMLPAKIMEDRLSKYCKVLATHPLFGPNSIGEGNAKGKIMAWHEINGGPFPELESFFRDELGLQIVRISPEAHDKEMAWVHGLTFFVGRGLLKLAPPDIKLPTGYYQKLQQLIEIEKEHSYELFRTVELGNPYAGQVRKQLLDTLHSIEADLQKDHL